MVEISNLTEIDEGIYLNIDEYQKLYHLEDIYWWYVALRMITCAFIQKIESGNRRLKILDAGCGTGGGLKQLSYYGNVYGIDISEEALSLCKKRGLNRLTQASINHMPFKEGTFDMIVSHDVICHTAVKDDNKVISEFHRLLKPGGVVLLNTPAYNWLISEHDKAVHTSHRYTRKEIIKKLRMNGLTVIKATYWNTILFPFLALFRLCKKNIINKKTSSDLKKLPEWINNLLKFIVTIECYLLQKINLPFGLSIFCIARKEEKRVYYCSKNGRDVKKRENLPVEIARLYANLGLGTKLYVKWRWRFCPYERIEGYVPANGKIIDLGCGYGLFANLLVSKSCRRSVIGVDSSSRRIEMAKEASYSQGNPMFLQGEISKAELNDCDSVIIIDVLHHVDDKTYQFLLNNVFEKLRKGGTLIIQEVGKKPLWKYIFAASLDRMLNIDKPLYYRSCEKIFHTLQNIGFQVNAYRIDKDIPVPDILFVCEKQERFFSP